MNPDEQQLQDLVRRFEAAWQNATAVEIAPFLLPADHPLRAASLQTLIRSDLEIRWRRGQTPHLEEYLKQFPELGPPRALPAALLYHECQVRQLIGDRPELDTYRERFPEQFAELQRLLREQPIATRNAPPAPIRPTRSPPADDKLLPLAGGYRLLERIGVGGFAEVWRAEAPGGFPEAVKILFHPFGHDEAQRELKALELMQQLRHPFLLQTQAAWTQPPPDSRLCIAMELADKNLRQSLQECQRDGRQGIPVDELLRYLREAA